MPGIAFSNRVISRDRRGRFVAAVDRRAAAMVRNMVEDGADLSRDMAPVGAKFDKRTPHLKDSIETRMTSGTAGEWYSTARHALPIEHGGKPHIMRGNPVFRFWWERMNRPWIPGLYGEPDIIHHPGNAAQPFLRPAYEVIKRRWGQYARRHFR